MTQPGQMKATIVADFSDFEQGTRMVAARAKTMGAQVSRALDGSKVSAKQNAAAFDALRASVDPAFAATQRYAAFQRQLNAYVEQGIVTQRAANIALEQAARQYLGVATAADRAAQVQREQTATVEQAAAKYQALRTSIDPVYAASKRYEAAQETLNAAVAAGIIKQEEMARALRLAEAAYLAPGVTQASTGVAKYGHAMTNASFQVQDFAVQVASGQSALIAFTQQFPQLVSVLGFSGKLALWGSGIGAIVAIAAMVIPKLLDVGKAAENAKEQLDRLNTASSALRSTHDLLMLSTDEMAKKYGAYAWQIRQSALALAELQVAQAKADLATTINAAGAALEQYTGRAGTAFSAGIRMADGLANIKREFGLSGQAATEFQAALSDLRTAASFDEHIAALARVDRLLKAVGVSAEKLPAELRNALIQNQRAVIAMGELQGQAEATAIAAGAIPPALNASAVAAMDVASRVAYLSGLLTGAANQAYALAAALGTAVSQLGGLASGLARLSMVGQGVAASGGVLGKLVDSAKISAASGALALLGNKLEFVWGKAVKTAKAGGSVDDALAAIGVKKPKGAGGGGGGSAGAAADALTEMEKAAAKLAEELSRPLLGAIDGVADAFGDFTARGFKDFKGFTKAILGTFQDTLSELVSIAARNRIMVALGIDSSGIGGGAPIPANGAPGGGPGVGGLASLISPTSWLGKGLASGKGFLGGIGKFIGYGAPAAAGTTAGLAGLGALIGTAGMILGGIGLVVGLGKALFGRTLKDTGVQGTFSDDGFSGQSYKFYKGGLLRSNKTTVAELDADVTATIGAAYGDLRKRVKDMAAILDLGSDAIQGFAHDFKISTQGMTDDQIVEAIQNEMGLAGAGMANLVLGTKDFTKAGESALDALARLSSSLTGVRDIADLLGHRFELVGLVGGDVASSLAEAFGGLEAMAGATGSYFQTFYTQEEQIATATRRATAELEKLGLVMPQTRAEYRLMIEALDLTDKKNHELYATLIGLAGVMDQVLPSVAAMTQQIAGLSGAVTSELDLLIASTSEAQRQSLDAARTWYRAAQSIREYIDRMRAVAGALVSADQARANVEARYQMLLASSIAGDATAISQLTGAADALLAMTRNTARTRVDLARAEARVLSDLGLVQGVADIEGARHDVIASLLGQQVEVLSDVREFLAAGGALDEAAIDRLNGQLGGLQAAIGAAEMINYQFLRERLAVTVDVIADADIPPHLRNLLANAATGVTGFVDFITRADLPADMKWLAISGASEHVKTIDYLAQNQLGGDLTRLALTDVSELQKSVRFLVGADLPDDLRRIALAGNSELARSVTATLSADISADAKRLALGNVGAYAVTVNAALSSALPAGVQRLILEQQGGYAAMIDAAISAQMGERGRRILLSQQGGYIANITGILDRVPSSVQALLLNANTQAARAVTIVAAFGKDLSREERAALLLKSGTVDRLINGALDLGRLTADQLRLLRAESGTLNRTIRGAVDLSGLSDQQKSLLDAITGASTGKILLGGSFTFDPAKGFAAWYEGATKGAITQPMDALRGAMGPLRSALDELRAALVLEGQRQERASRVAALNAYVGSLTSNADGEAFVDDAELARMAEILGINPASMSRQQLRNRVAGYSDSDKLRGTIYDPTGAKERRYLKSLLPEEPEGAALTLDDFMIFRRQRFSDSGRVEGYSIKGPLGGIRGNVGFGGAEFETVAAAQAWLKAQNYPAFARGGQHHGGPAYIGEDDLELVAPSRVYNPQETRAMLDNRQVVSAVRELHREVAALRSENTQLLLKIEGYERQMTRTLRDWDANGQPAERAA